MVGKASGWYKDPVPTAQKEVESGDLMECVLHDIGGAIGFKDQLEIKDKYQMEFSYLQDPLQAWYVYVSILCYDVNHSLLLAT